MPRRRFQRGRLIQRGKNPVWVGVFREDQVQQDGTVKRIQRSVVLGPVRSMSRRSALKAMQPYLDKINSAVMIPPKSGLTLERFVQEWRKTVAPNLRASTVRASESHLRAHILPKLGRLHLNEIDAKTVQSFVTYLAASGRSRKTIENVLLTLSTILRTARTWKYNCGSFSLSDLTLPREGVRKESRCFTDEEVAKIVAAAPEPLGTILEIAALLGLRIGETLALRVSDIDFTRKIIKIRQGVDAPTRTIQGVKSDYSSADLPMPSRLEARLKTYLASKHFRPNALDLLFVNKIGRPYSANKLREKNLHPLLKRLGIPRGGFHGLRHGVASALLADGITPAVVQRQLRHSDPRITLGIYAHVIGNQQRDAVENRAERISKYVN
jgi:integrase